MNLFVDAYWESLNHYGEELCGDKVEIVRGEDYTMAVLADGLGSGVKANILSTMTSKIISTMFSEGGKLGDVVETMASTLPVCSERGTHGHRRQLHRGGGNIELPDSLFDAEGLEICSD